MRDYAYVLGKTETGKWAIGKHKLSDHTTQVLAEINGNYIHGAIELDGDFKLRTDGSNSFELITDEYPWVFLVDSNNVLTGFLYQPQANLTPINFTNDVVKVSAVRGYRSKSKDVDQGFIVAFLRTDGTIWYTIGKYSSFYDTMTWQAPEQLVEAGNDNTDVQVVRVNDFRLCFYADYKGYITEMIPENWTIGDTFKPETINLTADVPWHNVCAFRNINITPVTTTFQWLEGQSDWTDNTITFYGNYPLELGQPDITNWLTFVSDNPAQSGQGIVSATVANGNLVITTKLPKSHPKAWFTVSLNNPHRLLYVVNPNDKILVPAGNIIHKPPEMVYSYPETINLSMIANVNSFSMSPLLDLVFSQYPEVINLSMTASINNFSMSPVTALEHEQYPEIINLSMTAIVNSFSMSNVGGGIG